MHETHTHTTGGIVVWRDAILCICINTCMKNTHTHTHTTGGIVVWRNASANLLRLPNYMPRPRNVGRVHFTQSKYRPRGAVSKWRCLIRVCLEMWGGSNKYRARDIVSKRRRLIRL